MEIAVLIPHFDCSFTDEYEWEGIRVIRYAENSIDGRKMIMGKEKPGGLTAFEDVLMVEKPDIIHFHELAPGRGFNIYHVQKAHELAISIVLTFHLPGYSCARGSLIYKNVTQCDGIIRIKRCTECVYQSKNLTGIKAKILSAAARILFNAGLNATTLNSTVGTALGFPFIINKIKKDLLKLSELAERIVVLGEWYKGILEKNGVPLAKLILIKQGLSSDIQEFSNRSKFSFPLQIVFIGRISVLKGLHLLIDAVCRLPEEKIALHIYGPETEDGYATRCKEKSKQKKNIWWGGTISSENVIATLSKYHVLCLPSTFSEMSPLVILEAFAAGIPVIASDVYGNAEQITHGKNGWLFQLNDSNDLKNKLQQLINDPGMIERSRECIKPVKTFASVAEEYEELYTEISENK